MTLHTEQDRDLARTAGFEVTPDVDQPGLWVWVLRDEEGKAIEGCDSSFTSEEDAWGDVVSQVIENTMAENNLSSEEWDPIAQARKLYMVRQSYRG